MANKKTETTEVKKEAPAKEPESVYTAEQLAEAYKFFETSKEIIVVALKQAGKKSATVSEAKKIINEFKNKEVK